MRILLYLFIFFLAGCTGTHLQQQHLHVAHDIPSGSSLALHGGYVYITGDDAPYIYKQDKEGNTISKLPIGNYTDGYRIPKPVKPDYECTVVAQNDGNDYLFAFGSGSLSPQRDSLLYAPLAAWQPRTLPLTQFYKHLQRATGIPVANWNIEGATLAGDSLLLANRGSNSIIAISWQQFMSYVFGGGALPAVRHYGLQLPMVDGFTPRVSGLCTLPDGNILFCASVEDTPDWHTDGPVVGSGIGAFDAASGKLLWFEMLLDKQGGNMHQKLESVLYVPPATILAVADNDDGSSGLFRFSYRR